MAVATCAYPRLPGVGRDSLSCLHCMIATPEQFSRASLIFCSVPQELNNRLAAEIARLRTLLTGDTSGEAAGSPLTQGKDAYELEVLLRARPFLHPALHRRSPKWEPGVAPSLQNHYRDETWR